MSQKDYKEQDNENMTPDSQLLQDDLPQETADAAEEEAVTEEEEVAIDMEKTLEALSNRVTETGKKLEAAEKEAGAAKEAHIRTLAEYDNYRKRTAKEKTDSYNNGLTTAVTGILPVIDALEMALAAPTTDENFKKGIEMTLATAQAALKNLGVEEIEAVDKPFDPTVHNAVMQEAAEGKEPGIVIRQLQKGYKIGDKIIRRAMVTVSC